MPEPRRPGRPPLPPEQRKRAQGIRLTHTAWDRLAQLAAERGTSQAEIMESLIANA